MDASLGLLLVQTVAIALGFLVAVAFYESLCSRDVLVLPVMRFIRRRTKRQGWIAVAYALAVFVGIPILVVLWTLALEITLVFVGSVQRLGNVALVATSIVAAARILAHIREATAHELAKAIPLSLAIILLTGGALNLEANIVYLMERAEMSSLTTGMIVFLLVLEIGMRLVTDASRWTLAQIRRRRGIDDDTGAWRTVWLGLRRTLRTGPEERPGAEGT